MRFIAIRGKSCANEMEEIWSNFPHAEILTWPQVISHLKKFHMVSSYFPPQKILWTQIISHLKKIEWPQLISHLNELIGESSWWSVPSIRRNSALKMINLNLNTMKGDGGRELNWARQGFLCFSRLEMALTGL